ncbi:MAG: isopenicillin N synthase family oxygenase [Bacteroidetes bacterium]|nr:isopenicillin N synthase family oxygenase [Bacteroidota bacterium]
MSLSQVPSVNLTHYTNGSQAQQQQFVADLGNAFSTIGFVALSGHYLEQQLSENLYAAVKQFFALPEPIKLRYEIEGLAGQRGYTSFGKETAKGQKVADLKEFWHFGQYYDPDSIYPPNIEVLEVPEFNLYGELVYKALEQTALELLRALSEYLSLPKDYFDSFIIGGNSILRPIHYPPVNENEQKAVRAAAHGDINLITLLMGAHGKGLQVQRLDGQWIDAIAAPDELMINVGDMLSRHTNNRLKSTIHRVINPERSQNQSRYSIPFFMHPKMTMPLNVLEHCISEDTPKLFEDITAGAFLDERLRELGLLK